MKRNISCSDSKKLYSKIQNSKSQKFKNSKLSINNNNFNNCNIFLPDNSTAMNGPISFPDGDITPTIADINKIKKLL